MNADAFRQYYEYHFAENRKVWDRYIVPLTQEQFTQGANYAHGSIRNQIVHLLSVDDAWFSGLRGLDNSEPLKPEDTNDRNIIRASWDRVEQHMRDYLATLQDDMLFQKPFIENDEDKDLILWQVLLHVVNHGTDHRAQLLRSLNDMGVQTKYQDYIFHVYEQLGQG